MKLIEQLGDGWTRDEQGQVRDPDGFVWYAHTQGEQQIIKSDTTATIKDTGTGGQKAIRIMTFKHPPTLPIPPAEHVYLFHRESILNSILNMGLTLDDNYPPTFQQSGDETNIILVCKPSNTKVSAYEGMKSGQGGVFYEKGQKVIAHKTDNVSDLLNLHSTKGENMI